MASKEEDFDKYWQFDDEFKEDTKGETIEIDSGSEVIDEIPSIAEIDENHHSISQHSKKIHIVGEGLPSIEELNKARQVKDKKMKITRNKGGAAGECDVNLNLLYEQIEKTQDLEEEKKDEVWTIESLIRDLKEVIDAKV